MGVIIHIEMPGKCCPPVAGEVLQSWVKALLHVGQQRGDVGIFAPLLTIFLPPILPA